MPADRFGRYLPHLRELPFVEEVEVLDLEPQGYRVKPDGLLRVHTPEGEQRFLVEEKRTHLSYALAEGAIAQMRRERRHPWMLFAPYVAPPMGRYLAERGAFYVDAVGNCHVRIGQDHIAHVEGRKPDRQRKQARGIGAAGYQALFALLAKPELVNATVRALGDAAGIGKTAAADTLRRLEEQGTIGHGRAGRRVLERQRMLDEWLIAWANLLRPRLLVGTFRTADRDPAAAEGRIERALGDEPNWAWGGGTAAMRLTQHYHGGHLTLYMAGPPADVQERLRAIPAEEGPLAILRTPGKIALEGALPRTVHPLLVYTDLLTTRKERAYEAAEEIRQRYLEAG